MFKLGPLYVFLFRFYATPEVLFSAYFGGNKEYKWAPQVHVNLFGLDALVMLGVGRVKG
jgi:hypothetical protein